MVKNGLVSWRYRSSIKNVVSFNDYEPETGLIKDNEFVHTSSRYMANKEIRCHCTCQVFSLLSSFCQQPQSEFFSADGLLCCHCELLCELLKVWELKSKDGASVVNVDHSYCPATTSATFCSDLNTDQIQLSALVDRASAYLGSAVVSLSSTESLLKYSVVSSIPDCQLVHIFRGNNQKWLIRCSSNICVSQQGKKKLVSTLKKESNICRHLKVMKQYPELWQNKCGDEEEDENVGDELPEVNAFDGVAAVSEEYPIKWEEVFDVASGRWRFKTFFDKEGCEIIANSDRNSAALKANVSFRDYAFNDSNCNRNDAGKLETNPVSVCEPSSSSCPCGAGWKTDANGEFSYTNEE